jgi:hypothetical protein
MYSTGRQRDTTAVCRHGRMHLRDAPCDVCAGTGKAKQHQLRDRSKTTGTKATPNHVLSCGTIILRYATRQGYELACCSHFQGGIG